MVLFPNCKINLGLNITGKREDGYHNLETVFYPIALKDALEAIVSDKDAATVRFSSSGLPVNGDPSNNLCMKAWNLLNKDFPECRKVQIHLHKAIPMGAGLGGGSADGAFTLLLLNQLLQLRLSEEQLLYYALQLGSDCPFFIKNKPCLATGRGEILREINLDLSRFHFVLVNPGIHISTAEAFANIIPRKPELSVAEIINDPIETWRYRLTNDFEQSIEKNHPAITQIKSTLYNHGALYASMSGSGSTVYGIFPSGTNTDFLLNPDWQIYRI
jgi:4-diphosphocytidyl-2-C-methyl-D-erythritol kinase